MTGPSEQEQAKVANLLQSGNYNKALETAKRLSGSYPTSPEVLNLLGLTHSYLGNARLALDNFDNALTLSPNFVSAYFNKGDLHRALGETDKAIQAYASAIAAEPTFGEAYHNMGLALQKNGDLDAAIGCFIKATELIQDFAAERY